MPSRLGGSASPARTCIASSASICWQSRRVFAGELARAWRSGSAASATGDCHREGSAIQQPSRHETRWLVVGFLCISVLVTVGFGPALGAGFAKDDFGWLWYSRIDELSDLGRVLTTPMGFYRPVTVLVWSFDIARAGSDPMAFAVTNLALHLMVVLLFGMVVRRLTGNVSSAIVAMSLAALSHHYSCTAVLWICGRGALTAALAATAAVLFWDRWIQSRRRSDYLVALALLALALGAYEGVAGVPLLLVALFFILPRERSEPATIALGGPLAILALYLAVRLAVGAMQPWAPTSGYDYTMTAVIPNLGEYASRAVLPGAVLSALFLAAAAMAEQFREAGKAMASEAKRLIPVGAAWFLLGILPTLAVLRRSDLYVYFGSLGVHLIGGAALAAGFRALNAIRPFAAKMTVAALATFLVLAWPFFAWDRNERLVIPADLATRALSDLQQLVPAPESGDCFVFENDREVQPNLYDAFSENLPFALALAYDRPPWEKAFYATSINDNALLSCEGLWRLRYLVTREGPESRVLELVSGPRQR